VNLLKRLRSKRSEFPAPDRDADGRVSEEWLETMREALLLMRPVMPEDTWHISVTQAFNCTFDADYELSLKGAAALLQRAQTDLCSDERRFFGIPEAMAERKHA